MGTRLCFPGISLIRQDTAWYLCIAVTYKSDINSVIALELPVRNNGLRIVISIRHKPVLRLRYQESQASLTIVTSPYVFKNSMATDVQSSLPLRAAKQTNTHPLAPVDANEIKQAASFVRAEWPADTDLHFKCVTLQEPAKREVVPYLEAEATGTALGTSIDRRVMVNYYIRKTNKFHEAVINLSTGTTEYNVRLGPNLHAPGDGEEIIAIERLALEDEGVRAAIAKLELPEGSQVVCDPWIYVCFVNLILGRTDMTNDLDRALMASVTTSAFGRRSCT